MTGLKSYLLALTVTGIILTAGYSASSLTPTKATFAKCYSKDGIPAHFLEAEYVVAAEFQDHTSDGDLSSYIVRESWKGGIPVNSQINILTPPSSFHGADYLKLPGQSYLFFLSIAKPSPDRIFRRVTCYVARPIELSKATSHDNDIIDILDNLAAEHSK